MSVVDNAKKLAGAVGLAKAVYSVLITVEGAPIREKDKPAKVKFAGLPVFDRDAQGKQHLFHWFRIRDART